MGEKERQTDKNGRTYREKRKEIITETKKQERNKFVNMYREEKEKIRNFLEYVSLLEEAVNSYNIKRALISVYEPSWNFPTDSLCINDRFTITSSCRSIAL